MHKPLLVTSAVAAVLTSYPSFAQQEGQQGPVNNQQITQEQATGPGTQIYLSTAGVRQIQQALNQQGYNVGQVTGQWTQNTAQAARNFQQANGLAPTGTLDASLVAALGVNQQSGTGAQSSGGSGTMQWS
jgi:peptidoglycan hydrolase-like protein with peptidoglycan-binding domain